PHLPFQDADLVAGGQDVGEVDDLLVTPALRHLVRRGVGERHADVLRLDTVDAVAEEPTSAPEALAVLAGPAERASPAGRDAGDEDSIARRETTHTRTGLRHRADRLVPEDASPRDGGDVAAQDVEVGPADRGGVDLDDRVRAVADGRLRD